MAFTAYFEKGKALYQKYERYVTPIAFGGGFVWDNFTLRIDLWLQNLQFLAYLIFAGCAILFINAYDTGRIHGHLAEKASRFTPLFLQFIFGGLFSAFLVFYSRSGSLAAAWPFLLMLVIFFAGNEFFRKGYLRLTFQMSVFFIALFSYAVFALPLVVGKIGDIVFIASGTAALLGIGIIAYLFSRVMPERLHQNRHALALSISSIYIFFQILYFANIIPPIPLVLKESGIYHSIEPARGEGYIYQVSYEPAPWYLFFKEQSDTFHRTGDQPVYSYSAIFAPAKFNMPIFHRWQYFDEAADEWTERARIQFAITGGRDGGYRGYTFKENIQPGKWRVEVITESDQILGRRTFKVLEAEAPPRIEFKRK